MLDMAEEVLRFVFEDTQITDGFLTRDLGVYSTC
jgi:hypothetical protein